jgi:hypothetical protein
MDTHHSHGSLSVPSDGVSRRQALLRLGASGLAVGLFARAVKLTGAQEATPAANELVEVEPLAAIPLEQLPPGPVTLELTRITLLPGFNSPPDAHGVLEIAHVESGTMICPGGEGRTVYGPDGTVTASGAGDLPVPAGSTIVVPPDAPDGARNEEAEPAVVLFVHIGPSEEEATPAAATPPG